MIFIQKIIAKILLQNKVSYNILIDFSKIYYVQHGIDLPSRIKTLKFAESPYINIITTKFGYPLTNRVPIYLNGLNLKINFNIYVK
jgi:hypothetical protein